MKTLSSSILLLVLLAYARPSPAAWDCNGPWKVMRNSKTSPRKTLGLNSRTGTCRPGDRVEVFCDDDKGGKYRTCRGSRRCYTADGKGRDCTHWDYSSYRPCPEGYRNYDCYGGCDGYREDTDYRYHDRRYNCWEWDYYYERPCPWGHRNYDCHGGCKPGY